MPTVNHRLAREPFPRKPRMPTIPKSHLERSFVLHPMMASHQNEPPVFSDEEYHIRHSNGHDESRQIWWPFMQNLGWVRVITKANCQAGVDHTVESRMVRSTDVYGPFAVSRHASDISKRKQEASWPHSCHRQLQFDRLGQLVRSGRGLPRQRTRPGLVGGDDGRFPQMWDQAYWARRCSRAERQL